MDDTDFFSTETFLPCRSVSDCSRLLHCLYRKQSGKYSAKWDRGLKVQSDRERHRQKQRADIPINK